jgi:P-type Ca2+ transporter type 2C
LTPQFQLTVSVTAVGFAFVSSVVSSDESSALTAVQLLWVNLLQDTLAALALATDPPTLELLDRQPEPKGSSLISFDMWKMIFGQSVVQLAVIFVLNFTGMRLFPTWDDGTMKTTVFNTFVWLQIFNEINCRRLDNHINVLSGIPQNSFFIVIMVVMVSCQTLIIFFGGAAFSVQRLNGQQWLLSIALGFLSIPAGALIRVIPNNFIKIFIPKCILERRTREDEERQIEDWDDAIEAIHDDLLFFKRLRGQKRFKNIGKSATAANKLVVGVEANISQSTISPERRSLDNEAQETNSPNVRRQPPTSLYSVNAASTLVPGLIALSLALAPTTLSNGSSAVETNGE